MNEHSETPNSAQNQSPVGNPVATGAGTVMRQSYAGVVRQHLLQIERGIANGSRHEPIRHELQERGFEASIGTFRKSLSRARIWWRVQLHARHVQQSILQAQLTPAPALVPVPVATAVVHTPDTPPPQTPVAVTAAEIDQFFTKRTSVFKK